MPVLARRTSFWIVAAVLVLLLFAASAPSPLYALYQQELGFSALSLTALYASYAITGLAMLLVAGRSSDYLGRRPILLAGLVINVAGMVAFGLAASVEMLFLGRLVTGVGTGLGLGAVSAWLVDLEPETSPGFGGLVSGAGSLLGLGGGAIAAGLLVQFGPDPLHFVYWLLAAAYAIAIPVVGAIPDAVARRAGWVASLRPAIGVPATSRSTFIAGLPGVIALWALGGLYLSLGPSLANSIAGPENRLAGGLVILALTGSGAIASYALRRQEASRVIVQGSVLLLIGVGVTLGGVAAQSIAVFTAGSIVAGAGLGSAFSAFVRAVSRLAPPEGRGGLLAAVYVVTYASFSIPAVIAGAAVSSFGLVPTAYCYGLGVAALAAMTTVAVARRSRRIAEAA